MTTVLNVHDHGYYNCINYKVQGLYDHSATKKQKQMGGKNEWFVHIS